MDRLNTLLTVASGNCNLNTCLLIDQIENQKLHEMAKNMGDISYTFRDDPNNTQCPAIHSWNAKKAYLCQLQWMARYLDASVPLSQTEILCRELIAIRQTSIDGQMGLPLFLKNDLRTLALYHPQWVKQKTVAEKIDRLTAYTTPEYR